MEEPNESYGTNSGDVYGNLLEKVRKEFTFVPYLTTAKNFSEALNIIKDFILVLQQAVSHAASEAQNELVKQRLFDKIITDDPNQAGESPALIYWRGQHKFYIKALNGSSIYKKE